jgi:hypothetical protein
LKYLIDDKFSYPCFMLTYYVLRLQNLSSANTNTDCNSFRKWTSFLTQLHTKKRFSHNHGKWIFYYFFFLEIFRYFFLTRRTCTATRNTNKIINKGHVQRILFFSDRIRFQFALNYQQDRSTAMFLFSVPSSFLRGCKIGGSSRRAQLRSK